MTQPPQPTWLPLVHTILATLHPVTDDDAENKDEHTVRQPNPALMARLRRGMSKNSEHYAYGDVLPYCEYKSQETPLLRACALIAKHPQVPHRKGKAIGRSLGELSHALAAHKGQEFVLNPDKPDVIAQLLLTLPRKNLDGAVRILNNCLALAQDLGVSFDYFELTKLLMGWGTHTNPTTIQHRKRPLHDYYRYYKPTAQDANASTPAQP